MPEPKQVGLWRPLENGYLCQFLYLTGTRQKVTPVYVSYRVVASPFEGLRWLHEVMAPLPQTNKGNYFERRGYWCIKDELQDVIEVVELGGRWWSTSFNVLRGQVQIVVSPVPVLPLVPPDSNVRRPPLANPPSLTAARDIP
ncbi:hypothetical protein ACFWP5_08855 [Streptomyces sp. NPDC058469]|uniref:hypothetical protein n=1 Tax=Streptomyces sp. NPDC058469 TaxID=3346514 RepID=UPI00365A48A1